MQSVCERHQGVVYNDASDATSIGDLRERVGARNEVFDGRGVVELDVRELRSFVDVGRAGTDGEKSVSARGGRLFGLRFADT